MVHISTEGRAYKTYQQMPLPFGPHLKRGPLTTLPKQKIAGRLLARMEEAMNNQIRHLRKMHRRSYSNPKLNALTFNVVTSLLRIYRASGFSINPSFNPRTGAVLKRAPTPEELAQTTQLIGKLLTQFPKANEPCRYLSIEESEVFFAQSYGDYIQTLQELHSLFIQGKNTEFQAALAGLKLDFHAACDGAPTRPYALRLYGNLMYDQIAQGPYKFGPQTESASHKII